MAEFYKEHWREIEAERLERYQRLFAWRPEMEPLLQRMDLRPGMHVLDFGCGPGLLAEEMARRVGDGGRVVGVDLNEAFLAGARERAHAAQMRNIAFVSGDGSAPLPDASFDRALCKNVLEYVTDAEETLRDLLRLLKPGGLLHISDSDWGFVLVHPWSPEDTRRLFEAAAPAFREPLIGRRLPGLLQRAGYVDIDVRVQAGVDRDGWLRPVLENNGSYARSQGGMPAAEVQRLLDQVDAAIAGGDFMMVLPQFSICARRP
jgi:ubiquinone/menaquinone biosynthesis C-methylase UbiE